MYSSLSNLHAQCKQLNEMKSNRVIKLNTVESTVSIVSRRKC
jgi:hypothetical protein